MTKLKDADSKTNTPEYKLDVLRIVLSDLSRNLDASNTEHTIKTLERAIYYIDNGDLPSTK
tara:strand:+ start:187 stop:369 length:183 start_codon:yes stop_codon:yes gene_type:complete